MKKYDYYISLEGLNFDRFFSELNRLNVTIFDYSRPNYKNRLFGIRLLDYLKIKKLGLLKQYKCTILKRKNIGMALSFSIRKCGIVLGVIISIILSVFVSNMTLKINVMGTEQIKTEEIIDMLKSIKVTTGKINTMSNDDIEQYLIQNNDKISLASVIKKGTNLIVNIKEKITKEEDIQPIYAPTDLVIKSIEVSQGTTQFKVGDIVKKGSILVDTKSITVNGITTKLKPIAKIEAVSWAVGQTQFDTIQTEYVRTGKKVVWSDYEFRDKKIFSHRPSVKFESYDKKEYNNYVFNNMFLPLKLSKTIFYETKEKTVEYNFEDYESVLKSESKKIAYEKLPNGVTVEDEKTYISNTDSHYYVTTYLEYTINIEG